MRVRVRSLINHTSCRNMFKNRDGRTGNAFLAELAALVAQPRFGITLFRSSQGRFDAAAPCREQGFSFFWTGRCDQ